MGIEVTFRQGQPAPDMTREQVVTWLLGHAGTVGAGTGLMASWGVGSMVDRLASLHDTGQCLAVRTAGGEHWQVTCTRTGPWYRRTYTFHADRVS